MNKTALSRMILRRLLMIALPAAAAGIVFYFTQPRQFRPEPVAPSRPPTVPSHTELTANRPVWQPGIYRATAEFEGRTLTATVTIADDGKISGLAFAGLTPEEQSEEAIQSLIRSAVDRQLAATDVSRAPALSQALLQAIRRALHQAQYDPAGETPPADRPQAARKSRSGIAAGAVNLTVESETAFPAL